MRAVALVAYALAGLASVLVLNADAENGGAPYALVALSLPVGFALARWTFLALPLVVVILALPFGYAENHLGSDAPLVWWEAAFLGALSAVALAAGIVVRRRVLPSDPGGEPSEGERTATALGIIAVLLLGAGLVAYRPAAFIGVDAGALAASIGDSPPFGGDRSAGECEESGRYRWTCDVYQHGLSGNAVYDISIQPFGCWEADSRHSGVPAKQERSGCINLSDVLGS